MQPIKKKAVKRNTLVIGLLAVVCAMLPLCSQAQEVKADAETDRAMTGEPIFTHQLYYTGMVDYEGEMIPSFQYSDFYVFKKLTFKSPAQARKYYKIANNIKKVYPLACEIQATVNQTIAHMDSLPTKQEKDAFLKQMEREMNLRRTLEGIAAAKARGVKFGRRPMERPKIYETIRLRWEAGELSAREAARHIGIAPSTFRRWVKTGER